MSDLKERDPAQQERLDRCVPVAKKVLALIVEKNMQMGDLTDEEIKSYEGFSLEVVQLLLDGNILSAEVPLVFQLAIQALQNVATGTSIHVENKIKRAEAKLWGKDEMDITLQDVDNVLRAPSAGDILKTIDDEVPVV